MIVVSAICCVLFLFAVLVVLFMARRNVLLAWTFVLVLPFFPTLAGYATHVAASSSWVGQTVSSAPDKNGVVRYEGVYSTLSTSPPAVRGSGIGKAMKAIHGLQGFYARVDRMESGDRTVPVPEKWFFCSRLPEKFVKGDLILYCDPVSGEKAEEADVVFARSSFDVFGTSLVTDRITVNGVEVASRRNSIWKGTFYFGFLPFFSGFTDGFDEVDRNEFFSGDSGEWLREADRSLSGVVSSRKIVRTAIPTLPSLDDELFD